LRVGVIPDGETDAARLIVPENPLSDATVIDDVAEFPACIVNDVGLEDMEKSGGGGVVTNEPFIVLP